MSRFERIFLKSLLSESKKDIIAVDLDGTLAYYDKWRGETHIGKPIPKMLERVKNTLAEGKMVKIFTARANKPKSVEAIKKWCIKYIGQELPITNIKEPRMGEFWDDRAVSIEKNTGEIK
jgi:hypothetical protein